MTNAIETISGEPAAQRKLPLQVTAGYLDNWAMRRAGAGRSTVFGRVDADVWVALFYAHLAVRFDNPVAVGVARREVAAHTTLPRDASALVANVAAYASAISGPSNDRRRLARLVKRGGGPAGVGSTAGLCWRTACLARASAEVPAAQRAEVELELDALRPRARRAAGAAPTRAASGSLDASPVALALAIAGLAAEEPLLTQAAEAMLETWASTLADVDRRAEIPTARLAQATLAAVHAQRRDIAGTLCGYLLTERLDSRRMLARTGSEPDGRFETSAWVPMALAATVGDLAQLEPVFDPVAPDPPDFAIRSARCADDGLDLQVDLHDGHVARTFEFADLDLILAQLLWQLHWLPRDDLSPRLHAHVVIGLLDVLDQTQEEGTRATISRQIETSMSAVLERQESNGGWQYARSAPSVIYSAGASSLSEFPDLQYTIDAAVPGIALCKLYGHTGDERLLDSALRAFRFLEDEVGRVAWNGRQVWRLYPGDEKTPKQGTAVNYELWVGAFLAGLVAAEPDDEQVLARARAYIDDLVDYAASHVNDAGDIAYGDYVRELRTPYASWDAYLLSEIHQDIGHERAGALARRIVRRVAEVQLPSGAIPNVVDYVETIGGRRRWLMHRHGVGPYPMRSYYLLYFVGAAFSAREVIDPALKALGFVLLTMFRPPFGDMSTGFLATGRFDQRPDSLGRAGRDWLLMALAGLSRAAGMSYAPDLSRVPTGQQRGMRLATDLLAGAVAELGDAPADDALRAIHRGLEALPQLRDHAVIPAAPRPRAVRNRTDHPALLALRAVARWAEAQSEPLRFREEELAPLADLQGETGLWAMRHRPAGDERQADVLVPLFELWRAGCRDDVLEHALRRGVAGAWEQLFDPATGGGRSRPGVKTAMQARLAFRHALAQVYAATHLDAPECLDRARLIVRQALMARTGIDGQLQVEATRERSVEQARAEVFEAWAVIVDLQPGFIPEVDAAGASATMRAPAGHGEARASSG